MPIKMPNTLHTLPVDRLIPYANNARTHSPEQVAKIAKSIAEFGFTNPILVAGSDILAGHGRLMAARSLGMKEVPCIDLSHMSKTQRKAYILADNKLALDAGWDDDLLKVELDDLKAAGFDLDAIGFGDADQAVITDLGEDAEGDEKTASPKACPHCGGAL